MTRRALQRLQALAVLWICWEAGTVPLLGQVMSGGGYELTKSRGSSGGAKSGGGLDAQLTNVPWMPGAFPLVGGALDLQSGFYSFSLFSRIVSNTIQSSNGLNQVVIPVNAVLQDFLFSFSDPLVAPRKVNPVSLDEANRKMRLWKGDYALPLPNGIQEILLTNESGTDLSLVSPASLSFRYNTVGGSILAGTNPPVREDTLSAWSLDEVNRLWVRAPSRVDAANDTLVADVEHFSVYALFGAADTVVTDIFAYPVPFDPNGPNSGTGAGKTGTEACGIIFSNVPSLGTIKIYTLSGDLVQTLNIPTSLPACPLDCCGPLTRQLPWDVKTAGGSPVVSGVYIWRAESDANSKTGKLMVIR